MLTKKASRSSGARYYELTASGDYLLLRRRLGGLFGPARPFRHFAARIFGIGQAVIAHRGPVFRKGYGVSSKFRILELTPYIQFFFYIGQASLLVLVSARARPAIRRRSLGSDP